jgi:hypothetical protein
LVVIGVVLLLQTLGVLSWGLWTTLWRFWPVLLILLGLSIVLRRTPAWIMPTIALLALAGMVGAAYAIHDSSTEGTYSGSFSEALEGADKARVEVDFGAGTLSLAELTASSDNLVEGEFSGAAGEVRTSVRREGDEVTLKLSRDGSGWSWGVSPKEVWDVGLSQRIPIDLDVDVGASDVNLDLSDLLVRKFGLETGAASVDVTFPRAAGETEASVRAGAASLDLFVPEGVAASITIDSGVSSVNVDEGRFPKAGDRYESPDFESAQNKLTLDIDVGAASLKVR